MKIFSFIFSLSKKSLFFAIITGALAGLCGTGILIVVHHTLREKAFTDNFLLMCFFAQAFGFLIFNFISQFVLVQLIENILHKMRLKLMRQLLKMPFADIEKHGIQSASSIFTHDLQRIVHVLERLPVQFMNIAILVGGLAYMIWISWSLFLLVVTIFTMGFVICIIPLRIGKYYMQKRTTEWRTLLKTFQNLTDGVKEILMHRQRQQDFYQQQLEPACERYMKNNMYAGLIIRTSSRVYEFVIFLSFGVLLFIVPHFYTLHLEKIIGFILATVFITPALMSLIKVVEPILTLDVSLSKAEEMGFNLLEKEQDTPFTTLKISEECNQLQLHNILYAYDIENESFTLGPISLSCRSGEIVFIVGDNGSGKTTLLKILCGLYHHKKGKITWNNEQISDENREAFRQNFSVIFSDFYLFDQLFGIEDHMFDKVAEYLTFLELDTKTTIDNKKFSTLELSNGQRRRLALLVAYLEDRPVYIFDEWAANQVPAFKRVFYEQILPDLKKRNKLVIAITHDQEYLSVADRVIFLEKGSLK